MLSHTIIMVPMRQLQIPNLKDPIDILQDVNFDGPVSVEFTYEFDQMSTMWLHGQLMGLSDEQLFGFSPTVNGDPLSRLQDLIRSTIQSGIDNEVMKIDSDTVDVGIIENTVVVRCKTRKLRKFFDWQGTDLRESADRHMEPD